MSKLGKFEAPQGCRRPPGSRESLQWELLDLRLSIHEAFVGSLCVVDHPTRVGGCEFEVC